MSDAVADVAGVASPGERLRRERELRGLTGQQAAEQLNLDVATVHAIESDDFAALGAPVFAKGHLRKYARLLSLDADDLLAGYERARAKPESPTLVPRSRLEMQPTRGKRRWPWAVGSLVVFLLAAGIVAWLSEGAPGFDRVRAAVGLGGDAQAPVATAPSPVAPAPYVEAVSSPASVPVAPPPETPAASATTPAVADAIASDIDPAVAASSPPVVAPGQVALQMRFAADSWVEVYDASGKAVLFDLGRAGSERLVSGRAPLSVTLGNAPAVKLSIGGKAATVPAPTAGTVSRFSVAADGSLR